MFNMARSPGHLNMIDESMLRKSKNMNGGKERKKTMEIARNKSAPKRRLAKQNEVMKSLPNQQVINRLVTKGQKERRVKDDEQILNINIKNAQQKKRIDASHNLK